MSAEHEYVTTFREAVDSSIAASAAEVASESEAAVEFESEPESEPVDEPAATEGIPDDAEGTGATAEEEGEEELAPPAAEPQPAKKPEKKVSGKAEEKPPPDPLAVEVEVELADGTKGKKTVDFLVREYQKGYDSGRRFREAEAKLQEANQREAGVQEIIRGLSPGRAVETLKQLWTNRHRGDIERARVELREELTSALEAMLDEDELPPEEKVRRMSERQRGEYERRIKEFEDREQKRAEAHAFDARIARGNPLYLAALAKYEIPHDSDFAQEAGRLLTDHARQGHEITKEVAEYVAQEYAQRQQKIRAQIEQGLNAEYLFEKRPEVVQELLAKHREKLKQARTTPGSGTPGKGSNQPPTPTQGRRHKPGASDKYVSAWEDVVPKRRTGRG